MDIETKLQRFSDVVLKEAEAVKDKQVSLLDSKLETSVSEFEQKANQKYAIMLEDAEAKADKEKQKQITAAGADVKKSLIEKRGVYIDQLFDNVSKKLDEFFKTAEYEQIIVNYIESYKEAGSELTAFIMKRDEGFKESIAKKTGIPVETVEDDFLGGVRIALGKNKVADCTFKERFNSEKAGFNKIRIQ